MTNSEEAFKVLAKAYCIPEAVLQAMVGEIRGDSDHVVSTLALATWLREQARKYERGMGHYGHAVRPETVKECALYRMAAERLEALNTKLHPPGPPIACA